MSIKPWARLALSAVLVLMVAACGRSPESGLIGEWVFDEKATVYDRAPNESLAAGQLNRLLRDVAHDVGLRLDFRQDGSLHMWWPDGDEGELIWRMVSSDEPWWELEVEEVGFDAVDRLRARLTDTHLVIQGVDERYPNFFVRADSAASGVGGPAGRDAEKPR